MSTWPLWTFVLLESLMLLVYATKHGEPRGTYEFDNALIGLGIWVFLLYHGGFFAAWGWAP